MSDYRNSRKQNDSKMAKSDSSDNYSRSKSNKRKRNRNNNKRGKEFELNVPDKDANWADIGVKGVGRDNDSKWYMHNPELVRDAAQIGYSWPAGIKLNIPRNLNPLANKTLDIAFDSIPGICAYYWLPTIGLSENYTSAINIAMQKLYAYNSYDISRTLSYDGPDLMNMILAMDSAYSFYSAMVRAYGTMQLYSSVNRYMPKALVTAMGFNYDDIQLHLSEFRYFINQTAYKLSSINVPAEMDYITRHVWMNTNIYTDAATPEAQMYLYVQRYFYQYVEVTEGPSYLQLVDLASDGSINLSYEEIVTFMNSLMLPILGSQDIGIMSGDILKTFKSDGIFTISPIAESYLTVPVYSQEVLSQFENATICGDVFIPESNQQDQASYSPNITQSVSGFTGGPALLQKVWFDATQFMMNTQNVTTHEASIAVTANSYNKLLNMHKADPTPDDNMVATRLTNMYTEMTTITDSKSVVHLLASCIQTGSEVVTQCRIFFMDYENSNLPANFLINTPVLVTSGYSQSNKYPPTNVYNGFNGAVTLVSQFDWHPNLPIVFYNGTAGHMYFPFLDTDNYAIISATDLQRLHDTALLSEFAVKKAWEDKM